MPDKDFCVYCETEDEAIALLDYLDDEGLRWANGDRPAGRTHWKDRALGLGLWYCIEWMYTGHEITFSRHLIHNTKYQKIQLDSLIGRHNAEISVNSICDFV